MIGTHIYKIDSLGKVRVWKTEITDLGNKAEIRNTTGLSDGKKIETITYVTEGKNLGKVNATTYMEQAKAEVISRYTEKLRTEYVKELVNAEQGVSGSGVPMPMLAQKYSKKEKKGYKTFEQLKMSGKEVGVQPKIDGNRCLIHFDGNSAVMWTRTGKQMEVQVKHILDEVCASLKREKVKDAILDGELFSEEMNFNTLNGILKRYKNHTEEDKEKLKTVKYYLYDIMLPQGYKERHTLISKLASPSVKVIENTYVAFTKENIQTYFDKYVERGDEGLMVRRLDSPYENKRTWQLMKVKSMEDAEFQVLGMVADKRGNFVGKFILKAPEGATNRDGSIKATFEAGVSNLTQEEGREIMENQDTYIGQYATVVFDSYSEYSIPRFPKFKGFRNADDYD